MNQMHFINHQRVQYAVQQLYQVLDVVPSHYYAWRHRQVAGAVGTREPAWETEMLPVFDYHKRRYDTRRLQVELREKGYQVGRQVLRTGLGRHQRRTLQPKAFAPRTTDSTHGQRCAPNLLLDQPRPTQANRVRVSNITYLPLANGPTYVPFRACAPSTWWAGRCGPTYSIHWLPVCCSGCYWLNDLLPT